MGTSRQWQRMEQLHTYMLARRFGAASSGEGSGVINGR